MTALHRFAQLVALATFALLIAGALVTSTDSGLSVPDWPLSYGTLFPPMVGGIRFEHTHRMIAGAVGLLILALAIWLARRESRRWVRRCGWLALGAVVAQALLGGLTVLWQLPLPVSAAHACLGQLVFGLVIALAVVASPRWHATSSSITQSLNRSIAPWAIATVIAAIGQLVLGALMRHSGQGLRAHVIGAGFVVIAILGCALAAWRHATNRLLRQLTTLLAGLLVAQLMLGVLTAWVQPTVAIRTAHVVTGAALLATAVAFALWACRGRVSLQRVSDQASAYVELTKPRLTLLAVMTTVIGYWLAARETIAWGHFVAALFGAALVGGGAAALNQYLEREPDAVMKRTNTRPLPTGRLTPDHALAFGVTLVLIGLGLLAWQVNLLTSCLGAITVFTYLFLYTPLKRVTPLCTLIGAIPGALPPLMGWAAARDALEVQAWALGAILFLWQLPHFLALAWLYRDDYARAGFKMLTLSDPAGDTTVRQIALYSLALLPATLLPTLLGLTGPVYFFGALGLSICFVACGILAAVWRSVHSARRLFLASVTYLPLLLTLMTLDRSVWRGWP